eukprot:363455-Chlamydomonas_euryale.AAC.12
MCCCTQFHSGDPSANSPTTTVSGTHHDGCKAGVAANHDRYVRHQVGREPVHRRVHAQPRLKGARLATRRVVPGHALRHTPDVQGMLSM